MKQIQKERNLWEYLGHTTMPIVVYGMGNGAGKLLAVCQKKGISISGMYCSDEFVRQKIFHGFVVGTRKQIEEQFQNFIVLVAFGSHVPGVMLQMEKTAEEYETYLPDLPLYGEDLFDRGFLKVHEKELGQVAELWEDEESRQLYHEILLYKWSGKLQYLKRIQYREQGYKEIFGIGRKEVYVDVGAYRGDTVERFIRVAGGYQKIVAIEPDEKTFIKLQKYCRDKENIECICAAAYCKDTFLPFSAKTGRNSTLAAQGKRIAAKKIDTILNGECSDFN